MIALMLMEGVVCGYSPNYWSCIAYVQLVVHVHYVHGVGSYSDATVCVSIVRMLILLSDIGLVG